MPRLDFRPERDGFHFANDFANRVGPFTTYGRCGGMVYAALDHYLTRTPVAHLTELPPEHSPLARWINRRQWHSMLNWSARRFLTWQLFSSPEACVRRSLGHELDRLRERIDQGLLTPLGLVAPSGGLSASHQVLAYGYEVDGTVYVWDNNRPGVECVLMPSPARDVVVEYDKAEDPGLVQPVNSWKGFFVHDHYDLSSPHHG